METTKERKDITARSAENGKPFPLDLSTIRTFEDLAKALASVANVPISEQIILYGPPFRIVDNSGLISTEGEQRSVLLYDRRGLQINDVDLITATDPSMTLSLTQIPSEASAMPGELAEAVAAMSAEFGRDSPLVQLIINNERQFMLVLNKGQALGMRAQQIESSLRRSVDEVEVQIDGVALAAERLTALIDTVASEYDDLTNAMEAQEAAHEAVLNNFEADLAELAKTRLYPTKGSGVEDASNVSLRDCINEQEITAMREECQNMQQRLSEEWLRVQSMWSAVAPAARASAEASVNMAELERGGAAEILHSAAQIVASQMASVAQCQKNYEAALRTCTQAKGGSLSGPAGEALQNLHDLSRQHKDLIPNMEQGDTRLLEARSVDTEHKEAATRRIRQTLRLLDYDKGRVERLAQQTSLIRNVIATKGEKFSKMLEWVQKFRSTHASVMNEVVRRRSYSAAVEAKISAAAEEVAAWRSREIVFRDRFLRTHRDMLPRLLPQDALAVLERMPPQFEPTLADEEEQHCLPFVDAGDSGLDGAEAVWRQYFAEECAADGNGSPVGAQTPGSVIMMSARDENEGGHSQGFGRTDWGAMAAYRAELYDNMFLQSEVLRWRDTASKLKRKLDKRSGSENDAGEPVVDASHTIDSKAREEVPIVVTADGATQAGALQTEAATSTELCTTDASVGADEPIRATTEAEMQTSEVVSAALPQESLAPADLPLQQALTHGASADVSILAEAAAVELDALRTGVTAIEHLITTWEREDAAAAAQAEGAGGLISAAADVEAVPVINVIKRLEDVVCRLRGRVEKLEGETDQKERQLTELKSIVEHRISFRDFKVGDLALFLPTSHSKESRVYLAFHSQCPHPYLAKESVEQMFEREGRFPDFILGRVILIESRVAGEVEAAEGNPYDVAAGKPYTVLTAMSV